jgi:predicted RNase H-related nuclease YkuK (DUF458 family)
MTFDIDEVRRYITNSSMQSKIYIGGDSERIKLPNGKWVADYATVVVIHIDGKHGAKIFGEVTREPDFDHKIARPSLRLMNEVYKVAELYFKLADCIGSRMAEIHLDLNPDERHGSSCVVTQAVGYILGTCNIKAQVKPNAFAASIAADRFKALAAA